ncbi:helix-turn-helix domain protein [Kribbella flavida DSM 17836]|uniref:Helix-turn-helix domain protein n=1 Tax=Kribbella flavida (strain DSM 17836 / JCM 10339 / NBRC 14399) TaxID=479435 RepID=D2PNM7_KRIFD|nr:helix-turn-helix transcriptional regulator [Kribbella flavida]ADB30879.1 helix-turn-helix domain protein [Kribbella flavida DSM 17836]
MDREQLADFLRIRRERLRPSDVGLPAGLRRRTPGLRREEVAALATMSTDYYTRLEQGRGPRPSRPVLTGLARALRLSTAERDHLFRLAGEQPAPPPGPPAHVRTGVLRMLTRLDVPGLVLDAKYDVLAWNPLAAALLTDFSAVPSRERNLLRLRFLTGTNQRELFGEQATKDFARQVAADLRAATSKYPDDPSIAALVTDLTTGSEEFAQIWSLHEVATQETLCQTIHHPVVGRIDVVCEILLIPERDQRVVLYTADPGSPSDQSLRLLEVVGTQSLAPS